MDVEFFVCDDAEGLIRTRGSIARTSTIIYETQVAEGETGDLLQRDVAKRRSAARTLSSFSGKFILVAVRR